MRTTVSRRLVLEVPAYHESYLLLLMLFFLAVTPFPQLDNVAIRASLSFIRKEKLQCHHCHYHNFPRARG